MNQDTKELLGKRHIAERARNGNDTDWKRYTQYTREELERNLILEGHEEVSSFESMTGKGENSEKAKSVN